MNETTTITPPPEWTSDETKAGRRLAGAKLDAARAAVQTLDGVVKWAAYEDEAEKSLVVTTGPALKALGDGKIGGHLVIFGGEDLTGDFFVPDTDYDLEDGQGKATVLYHHGMDATLKRRKLGRADLRVDDVGVWMEAQLALRDDYERALYGMIEAGKMGLSSGTAPHLVEREPQANGSNKITRWPLGLDASITPIPAEPRTSVVALKTYLELAEPHVKALVPQDAAIEAASADATKATPEPEPPTPNDYEVNTTMTPEEAQALIAETIKAYDAKLAAEPPVNPAGVAVTKPAEVKSKPEMFATLGEQLWAVKNAALGRGYDRRLDSTKAILGGNESVPSEGGFLVATEQDGGLDKKVWDSGVFASRAQQRSIAAGANSVDFYGLSENSRANGSRYGGVTGYRMAEGATITQSTVQNFYRYTLKPKKYGAVAYLTDEVINDKRLLEQELQSAIVNELAFMVDDDMLNGLGVAGAHGVLNHACLVTASKEVGQAVDTIVYENLLKMWVRRYPRGQYAWFINQQCEPQLALLYHAVGTAGLPPNFITYSADGVMRIFGAPVVVTEFNSGLGDLGDILLADWSQYKLATIGGVEAASSMHVQFLTDQMCYRFTRRVDGLPTWQSALTPYKGTANTMSPFITLEAR